MQAWAEGKTVLLLLGYPALCEQVRQFIQASGFQVLLASSARQALEISRSHTGKIDLLVSEYRPHDMPAKELVARMRQSRPNLPAIVLTPEPEEVAAKSFGHAGVSFLETPFAWSLLADRLTATLSGRLAAG